MTKKLWILGACLAALPATLGAGELVVDDFEDGDLESKLGLAWMVIADDVIGGASEGRLEVGTASATRTLTLTGERRKSESLPVAFVGAWTAVGDDGRARDLSEYQGLRLRARAPAGRFQAGFRRAGVNVNFAAPIELGPDWTDVDVPFAALRPLGPPGAGAPEWSAADLTWVGISSTAADDAPVRLEIDALSFYGGPTAERPKASTAASGSVTATEQLADAASLAALAWRPLAEEEKGDALRPRLPDALALDWAAAPDGRIWFRVTLADPPPEPFMGINVALDVDGDPANGMAWWGSNSAFRFDELVTAYLTRTESYWMGAVGVASADDVGRFVMDGRTSDVRAAVDRDRPAFLVGVPRSSLPASGKVRLIATVGSAMVNNDDLPNSGSVELELPCCGAGVPPASGAAETAAPQT